MDARRFQPRQLEAYSERHMVPDTNDENDKLIVRENNHRKALTRITAKRLHQIGFLFLCLIASGQGLNRIKKRAKPRPTASIKYVT